MDTLRQDLRFALRMARRSPGVTAVIVLSVALGIGAVTTLLDLAYVLLVRPLPFPDPERLVAVMSSPPSGSQSNAQISVSPPDFADFRREATCFSKVGVFFPNFGWTLTGPRGAERVTAALVSAEILPLLGASPALGRGIDSQDDQWTATPVVLLGWDLWKRRFGGDPKILGRTVQANGMPYRVIGIMPAGFGFPFQDEAWIPLWTQTRVDSRRDLRRIMVLGKLGPGVTLEAAGREAEGIARSLAARHPETNGGWGLKVVALRPSITPEALQPKLVLSVLIAVLSVFLIACANVASLLLAHAADRRREIAMRAALGAGSGRLARMLLTESIFLAAMGGAAGLALGLGGVRLLEDALGPLPYGLELKLETPAFLAALVIALAAGVLFGLAPALQAIRLDLGPILRAGGRAAVGRGTRRLHNGLVVAETAVALVLLVATALSLRSLATLQSNHQGMVPERLLTANVQLSPSKLRFLRAGQIVRRLAAVPGIEAAAAGNVVPFGLFNGQESKIEAEGAPETIALQSAVTSGFFRTIGVPILAGRDLTPDEGMTMSDAAVISASLARRLWPDGHAVGRRLRIAGGSIPGWLTVVGVNGDFTFTNVREESKPAIYVSSAYNLFRPLGVLVRSGLSRPDALKAIERAVREVDPDAPLFVHQTMDELRDAQTSTDRLLGGGLAILGGIALLFAGLGTYGVLAYAIGQRRREIGIRLALGAPRRHVFSTVIGRGMSLTLLGLVLGLLAALPVAKVLSGQLYHVSPTDPLSFGGAAMLLLDAAFIACYLPARRALEVDPREALVEE